MSFREKLAHAATVNRTLLCVGLDPDPSRIPPERTAAFLTSVVEATRDLVCAYKPNLAFYEQLGETGYSALRAVLAAIPDDIPVIADAKRGDVAHTAEAYARAIFDELGFDAATVNPYLGGDSVEPFVSRADRGVFIVCRTSNPGARDLQDLRVEQGGATRPLYQAVAELAKGWDRHSNVGLVVGATYPDEMRELRSICPDMPFLVPGVGAQQGELERSVQAGLDAGGGGMVINAARSVLYTARGPNRPDDARRAAQDLRDAIEQHRLAAQASPPR
jgi:orotidine-5'-phosphate decarboxylase